MKIAIIDDDSTMTKQIEDYLQKLQKEVDTIFELEVFPSVLSVASSWEGAAFRFSLLVMLQPFHKM